MKTYHLLFLVISFYFSSCSYYYYPTQQAIPTQTEKNELQLNAHIDLAVSGASASYSLTDHIGVLAKYASVGPESEINSDTTIVYGKESYLADFGAFYYGHNEFLIENYPINMVYGVTGAYSFGKQRHFHDIFDMKIDRIYIQPSLAFTSKFIEVGLSTRCSYVDYTLDSHVPFDRKEYEIYNIEHENFYFFEPQVYAKVGYRWVKVGFFINRAFNLTNNSINYEDDTGIGMVFSLQFKLNDLFKN